MNEEIGLEEEAAFDRADSCRLEADKTAHALIKSSDVVIAIDLSRRPLVYGGGKE